MAIYRECDPTDESDWPTQHEWLADRLNRMHRVLARVSRCSSPSKATPPNLRIQVRRPAKHVSGARQQHRPRHDAKPPGCQAQHGEGRAIGAVPSGDERPVVTDRWWRRLERTREACGPKLERQAEDEENQLAATLDTLEWLGDADEPASRRRRWTLAGTTP